MELIPILIIVLGVVSSIVGSKKNKEEENKRDIDTSKLDRRQNTAPRSRQPEATKNEQKGFFESLQEAFDQEFNKPEPDAPPKREQTTQTVSTREVNNENRPTRQSIERPVRETIQKTRDRVNSSQNISDIEKRITDRSAHAKRASEAREKSRTEGYNERVKKSEGIGRDIIDQARYSFGDDVTKMHTRGQEGKRQKKVTSKDLTFDNKAIVNGIILSEVLGKPVSKR